MSRYIPNTDEQRKEMLATIGVSDVESLFKDIPESVRLKRSLNLPASLSELELRRHMSQLTGQNKGVHDLVCFLGAGAYDHYIPSVIDHMLVRQEFYTAYTPYQPEISQGTLQAIFEYQSMICELTGMEVANASLYDGATALGEAAAMACAATKGSKVLVSRNVNPQGRAVLSTYCDFRDILVSEVPYGSSGQVDLAKMEEQLSSDTAAVIIQSPNFFGIIEDIQAVADLAHKTGALLIVYVDPISLALLKPPGELGADIVLGDGQPLGNPLSFGGPHLGFMAARQKLLRTMPGRIVGLTSDKEGQRAFVLTMQTREQHIRREKATSNICSNNALNALAATIYMSVMGKQGLREVALQCLNKANYAYQQLLKSGQFEPVFAAPFLREFLVKSRRPVGELNQSLLEQGILGGYAVETDYPELAQGWLVAVTEKRSKAEIDDLVGKVVG